MSNKNSWIGLVIAVTLCIGFILYYNFFLETKDEFLLDNPTESSIKVVFNGEEYLLAPGQMINATVLVGKNTISSASGDGKVILKDTFFNISKPNRGIINPTLSNYYTFRRYYGHVKNIDSLYNAHKIQIDKKQYVGDIKEHNALIIQDFYFNINRDFPKLINKVDTIESRVKLFRKNQFLEFYQSSFE